MMWKRSRRWSSPKREVQLRDIIDQLQRWRFGPRSEKLSPDQYDLTLEDREIANAEAQTLLEMQQDVADRARGKRKVCDLAKAGHPFPPTTHQEAVVAGCDQLPVLWWRTPRD
ncbi:hypothetical protein BHUM_02016 [Candidatus Burkholderia humilis]|nr:hypothetical protein BHUM_02016 [Candidatus Burkholderia humilis]